MGKIFTTETTDTINVAMAVEPRCYDDRYVTEVQSAGLKVWNEGTRLFCSVKATLEIVDTENPRNTASLLLEEEKVALPSLSKDITYHGTDDFVTVESVDAMNNLKTGYLQDMIDCLEIDVRIEGI